MPSSINSTSSSPGGLITTGATDNELVIQTGDTTAISVDAAQNVTIAGDLTVNGTFVGGGDVSGPASSTDNAVARFDSTTGKVIQNSSLVVNDSGEITAGVWQGTEISVAKGGTGSTTLTANNVILGNGTSAVQFVAPGTNGNVLTSNGTTWTSATPAGGGVTSLNGQTGAITNTNFDAIGSYAVFYYGATSNAVGGRFSSLAVGTTIAGSSLRYNSRASQDNIVQSAANMSNQNAFNTFIIAVPTNTSTTFPTTNTTTVSGTWRLMSSQVWAYSTSGCAGTTYYWYPGLYVRIS